MLGGLWSPPRRGKASQVARTVHVLPSRGPFSPGSLPAGEGSGASSVAVVSPGRNFAGAQHFCLYAACSAWVLAARAGKCSAWGPGSFSSGSGLAFRTSVPLLYTVIAVTSSDRCPNVERLPVMVGNYCGAAHSLSGADSPPPSGACSGGCVVVPGGRRRRRVRHDERAVRLLASPATVPMSEMYHLQFSLRKRGRRCGAYLPPR